MVLRLLFFPALILCCMLSEIFGVSGDVGSAMPYHPPYLPTRCEGYNQDQFPASGQFVAVSDSLWDNGAACGRRYRMRCISGPRHPCKDEYMVVEVVDFCNDPCPVTLRLSDKAFDAISKLSSARINVEYMQ
ncbi:hypothetical protein SLE2022_186390 [Rubroshorea leprosula]